MNYPWIKYHTVSKCPHHLIICSRHHSLSKYNVCLVRYKYKIKDHPKHNKQSELFKRWEDAQKTSFSSSPSQLSVSSSSASISSSNSSSISSSNSSSSSSYVSTYDCFKLSWTNVRQAYLLVSSSNYSPHLILIKINSIPQLYQRLQQVAIPISLMLFVEA